MYQCINISVLCFYVFECPSGSWINPLGLSYFKIIKIVTYFQLMLDPNLDIFGNQVFLQWNEHGRKCLILVQ